MQISVEFHKTVQFHT